MFVGQRKDPFVVNLGETFDLINLSNPLGPVDGEKDSLADKNVTSLILELPKSCLTNGSPVIAGWTTASQFQGTNIVQVSRLGQPLVNEVVIGLKDKDTFNASQPKDDAQFAKYVTNPTLPALIELLFGSAGVRAPTNFPRTDLVTVFLTGVPGLNQTTATAELLRLNTSTPALAAASQNNLGVIAGDVAGFPNGRRPGDDVVDIALRVVMGKLLSANDAPSGQLPFTDGALVNAGMFQQVFPYLNPPLVDVQAVNALAVLPDGTVLLGGQFNLASAPTSLTCVAYWTGTNWASLGVGVNNTVISLTVLDKNSFVAAGAFLMAGGHHASRIARWDGAGWDFYGSGFSQPGAIGAFARMPNGDIIAGGDFTGAGTVDATNVARWNGHSWSSLGLSADGAVRALAVLTNGDLVVGGKFSVVNGFPASNLARWDGANWSAPAPGPGGPVSSLAVMPNGDLIVGGMFSNVGSSNITGVARWDGTNWSGMGAGLFDTYALKVMPNGDLFAGGYFSSSGATSLNYIARWNGTEWVPLGAGMNNDVEALATASNGDLLAGGQFGTSGNVATGRIAQWDGSAWSGFGSGLLPSGGPSVEAIAVLTNGNMVIGGSFAHVGSTNLNNLALWNGSTWVGVGAGTSGTSTTLSADVLALLPLPDGGFVAGGSFAAIDGHISSCFGHWGCPITQPLLTGLGVGPLGPQFTFQGAIGWTYGVQYSTNLQNWLTLTSGLSGTVTFQDTDPGHTSHRAGFYRVVQE